MLKRYLAAALVLASADALSAETYHFDPGVDLIHIPNNPGGFFNGRSIFFQALVDTNVYGAGFFNGFTTPTDRYTMKLYTASSDGSFGTLLGMFSEVVGNAGHVWRDKLFTSPIPVEAGSYYHLYVESADDIDNYLYDWDGPPVNIDGMFSIIDGFEGTSLSDTQAPALRVLADPVPEPATMIALSAGVAMLAARRRRKHS